MKCSLCGASNVSASTCPHNPHASSHREGHNVSPLTIREHENALDVACMKLIGFSDAACQKAQQQSLIAKILVDERAYASSDLREELLHISKVLNKGNGCVIPNLLELHVDNKGVTEFTVSLGSGKRGEQQVPLDIARFQELLHQCGDAPIIAITMEIKYANYVKKSSGRVKSNIKIHANMVVVNHLRKEVEHYEPLGDRAGPAMNRSVKDQEIHAVRELFAKLFPGYKYIRPVIACPKKIGVGPQSFLNTYVPTSVFGGTCMVWSYWIMNLRLANPSMDSTKLLEYAMSHVTGSDKFHIDGKDARCMKLYESRYDYCDPNMLDTPLVKTALTRAIASGSGYDKIMRADHKYMQESCKDICAQHRALVSGGKKMEEYIIEFTNKLVQAINYKVFMSGDRVCVDTEGGRRVRCFEPGTKGYTELVKFITAKPAANPKQDNAPPKPKPVAIPKPPKAPEPMQEDEQLVKPGKPGKPVAIPKPKPSGQKPCPPHKIRNPKSGRCVNRDGKIGKAILAAMGKK